MKKRYTKINNLSISNKLLEFVDNELLKGTKILPKADIKFFFKCDLNTASKRRFKELKKINKSISLKDVKKAIKIRNYRDTTRKNSPLLKSRDAIIVDTGKLKKIPDMINKMSAIIRGKIKLKYGN